jgi:hypothetical protein
MSTPDFYDVQALIHDARGEISGEIRREVRREVETLRSEVRAVADELRETIAQTERTMQSRTEHLV